MTDRRAILAALALSTALAAHAAGPVVDLYKNAGCGCCGLWAAHLERAGFSVRSHEVPDASVVRRGAGIPAALGSCHTAIVGAYAIEGHVPAADVKRLLRERPANAVGLAVAGMPAGSPGMEGAPPVPYEVRLVLKDGTSRVYARH